ncbi:hypothetical protein Msil_3895 [Methylocella silvestris BL2]|uniref:Uncharacterized protein n=1 Tax=Methylocella silvestris (strain DSM 15510 / CIP 108128 / LMG 27833 / NCIMB 13906 / BL2) TaxID=395965 RepID=B8EMU7_METSB|nr:hypothetical protein [Methylocella silvestris]ACK52776.1 hypothetical protein Msil_3895 [Methylocella silvestris BL2]
MKSAERQPVLETLSNTEKDALILRLWDDLREERARSQRLAQGQDQAVADVAGASDLLAQQQGPDRRQPPSSSVNVNVRLGRGLGLLRPKVVIGAIALVALAFGIDAAISWRQRDWLEQKRLAGLALEHAAYSGVFVELVKVAYEPDQKSYRLTMAMQNLDPLHPIYVMRSPLRVFEQSGLTWREVPARAPNGVSPVVVKLADRQIYETIFEPNLKEWTELLPGYMHIRFESSSLISQRSEPEDDIVDRTDRYFVYLKPHGADDEAIRKRMKYSGEPPVYIPMPPH